MTLKPCPFCGRSDLFEPNGNQSWPPFVQCPCGARGVSGDDITDAVRLWNTRAVDPRIRDLEKAFDTINEFIGTRWWDGIAQNNLDRARKIRAGNAGKAATSGT